MSQEFDEPEWRTSERTEADEAATILFPISETRVPCRLLNRSESGVLLKISASARLPAEFILLAGVPETRTMCRIAWRVGSQAGCEFISQFSGQGDNEEGIQPAEPEHTKMVIKSRVLKRPLIVS